MSLRESTAGPRPWRLGVFDSGVGGLSVLRALRAALPGAHLMYVADSAWAPYGERSEADIFARSDRIARFLREQRADLLVVACNTATAAAVHHLRHAWPDWPIVGVEPGLKPAVRASRNGRIGVLATDATLRSDKFQRLLQAHGHDVHIVLQPCPGLAQAIEAGDLDDPALVELVEHHCAPLREAGVDTVVLGCTHYPFVARHIARALGTGVQLIDTAQAVAQRALALCEGLAGQEGIEGRDAANPPALVRSPHAAPVPSVWRVAADEAAELWSSGDPARLARIAAAWLSFPVRVRSLPAEQDDSPG